MFTEFIVGQAVRHLDLDPRVVGIVESNLAIRVHLVNSPVREMLNVKVGDNDLVWWRLDRVAPVPVTNIPLTAPASDPAMVIA